MEIAPTTLSPLQERHARIARALARHAHTVAPAGTACWEIALEDIADAPTIAAAAEDDWIELDTPAPAPGDAPGCNVADRLALNAVLPADSALELCIRSGGFVLHSARPLDPGADCQDALERGVAQLCVLHRRAWALAATSGSPPANPTSAASAHAIDGEPIDALCRELGWPHIVRPGHPLAVQLECSRSVQYAEVGPGSDRLQARLFVSGLDWAEIEPCECRDALGLLLLRVAGAFRALRAVIAPDEAGRVKPALEACLPADAPGSRLHLALCALSTAADACALEADALARDPTLARAYLEHARPGGPGNFSTETPSETPQQDTIGGGKDTHHGYAC